MSKQYKCFCGDIVSEDSLVQHYKSNHVEEFTTEKHDDLTELNEKLKGTFPNATIDIKNGKGWYAKYIIKITQNGTTVSQYLGTENEYYKVNPESIDDAIRQIKYNFDTANMIVNRIKDLGDFSDVKCTEFSYGYSDDEDSYTIVYKVKETDEYIIDNYYPYNSNLDNFLNKFKVYFATLLEGKLESTYDDGYFTGLSINKIPIISLHGKNVRLEVLN